MKKAKIVKLVFIFSLFASLFVCYCFFEARWVKLTEVEINTTEIPDSFNGFKIVFISDIHHGPYLSIQRITKLVKRINALNPDIIILGGDYVHREARYIKPVFTELSGLKAKIGIYGVLGNHDHWENAELTRQMMALNGIKDCDNQSYWIRLGNDSIKIGGVGDLWEDTQLLNNTICDVTKKNFCILISHNPDYVESIKPGMVDLTLSGHTHGGQMTLFGYWAPVLPSRFGQKYRYGLQDFGTMKSYITSGIGTITPPLRFFCRPEIVLIKLAKTRTRENN